MLNNALEGILPKTSSDTPNAIDIDSITGVLSEREKVTESLNDNLSTIERAYIVSKIAMRNQRDAQLKNEVVNIHSSILQFYN